MKLEVQRFFATDDTTIGFLGIDGESKYFTLEDEHREEKVMHETRIPAGIYNVKLREHGGFHQRYASRFASIHRGMLELENVPGFTDILIHCGNDDDDTSGCLLVGMGADLKHHTISKSTSAYKELYLQVLAAMDRGEEVTVIVYD